jgi:predicted RecA/RadA family phage recombinase
MASALSSLYAHYGDCDTLPYTNTTGSAENGDTVKAVQNKVGILKEDVADDESTVILVGVPAPGIDVPKQTGQAWTAGDAIYYDSGSNDFSNNSADGELVGHAYADAAASDATARVVLTNEAV